MATLLHHPDLIRGIWHDAHLHFTQVFWAADGTVSVRLRCEINHEEDTHALRKIGIVERVIDLEFRDVLLVRGDIHGYSSSRETIMDWLELRPSALIDEISTALKQDLSGLLRHHQFVSLGSTIDIVSLEVWIQDVPSTEA